MAATILQVEVDYENNAETWWDALRAHAEGARIEASIDAGWISRADLALCESLPGWTGGPEIAPNPLVVQDAPLSDGWVELPTEGVSVQIADGLPIRVALTSDLQEQGAPSEASLQVEIEATTGHRIAPLSIAEWSEAEEGQATQRVRPEIG